LIKRLAVLRDRIKKKNAEADELKASRDEVELELIELLSKMGIQRLNNGAYTASLATRVVPTVTDWDEFYKFIRQEDALYMLERRPSATAYRDMLDARAGQSVPGVEPYEKKTISLRATS